MMTAEGGGGGFAFGTERSVPGRESTLHTRTGECSLYQLSSGFSMRIFTVNGAVTISYSSRLNRL